MTNRPRIIKIQQQAYEKSQIMLTTGSTGVDAGL